MTAIKEKLAQFISHLEGANEPLQQELNKARSLLQQKHIQISETDAGKEQVAHFLRTLFTYAPELQNEANKTRLIHFVQDNINIKSNQPSHRTRN